jgi:hypothetical protein
LLVDKTIPRRAGCFCQSRPLRRFVAIMIAVQKAFVPKSLEKPYTLDGAKPRAMTNHVNRECGRGAEKTEFHWKGGVHFKGNGESQRCLENGAE